MSNTNQNSTQHVVIVAITWVLRPIIKLLIHHQITYPFLSDLIKRLYLDVALKDIPSPNDRLTDSRLSVLTGVHRKDIRRLRDEPELLQPIKDKSISLSAQVISTWMSDPAFCQDDGTPKHLARLAADGHPSFEDLVEYVSKQDLRARTLLDEWLRLGTVSLDNEQRVKLNVDSFGPNEDFDEKIYFFKRNLHDHLAASVINVLAEKPPHFDRFVYFNNLSEESVSQLKQFASQESMELIKQINRKGRALQIKDKTKTKNEKYRINFGAFFYAEENATNEKKDVE